MMKEGRLIWSKQQAGGWHADEHGNGEHSYYIAKPVYRGHGWDLELVHVLSRATRDTPAVVERESMGWSRYLADAKRKADARHHQRILDDEEASQGLKDYIRRYLIS